MNVWPLYRFELWAETLWAPDNEPPDLTWRTDTDIKQEI